MPTGAKVERHNSGRELYPLESSALHGALYRQVPSFQRTPNSRLPKRMASATLPVSNTSMESILLEIM
jgi:hypothetical protein